MASAKRACMLSSLAILYTNITNEENAMHRGDQRLNIPVGEVGNDATDLAEGTHQQQ